MDDDFDDNELLCLDLEQALATQHLMVHGDKEINANAAQFQSLEGSLMSSAVVAAMPMLRASPPANALKKTDDPRRHGETQTRVRFNSQLVSPTPPFIGAAHVPGSFPESIPESRNPLTVVHLRHDRHGASKLDGDVTVMFLRVREFHIQNQPNVDMVLEDGQGSSKNP